MPFVALLLTALAGLGILLGSVAFTYRDASDHGLDPDTWSAIVAVSGAFALVATLVQLPMTGWIFPLPSVGLGFLVYLLVRGEADETAPSREVTLPGRDED